MPTPQPKHDDEHDGPWWVGVMICRLCGHKQVSVVPVTGPDDDLLTRCECGNCGNLTAEAEEYANAEA